MFVTDTIDLEIEKIKLFGEKIFKGYSWTPDNDILSLKIWDISYDLLSCSSGQGTSEVNVVTLESNGELSLYSDIYTDDPWPMIFYADLNGDGVTWYEANTFCNILHGTQLVTIDSQDKWEQLVVTIGHAGSTGLRGEEEHVWVGLNDIDSNNVWSWIENDEEFIQTNKYAWNDNLNYGGECADYYFYGTMGDDDTTAFVKRSCNDTLNSFMCTLPDITDYNEKYIGVYTYIYNTWDEENDYCNDAFGTELATILWDRFVTIIRRLMGVCWILLHCSLCQC